MCHHWQKKAILEYKKELPYKNLRQELDIAIQEYKKAWENWEVFKEKMNNLHLSKWNKFKTFLGIKVRIWNYTTPIGYFSGQLYYKELKIEAINEALSKNL
jgi:hypothetical protein